MVQLKKKVTLKKKVLDENPPLEENLVKESAPKKEDIRKENPPLEENTITENSPKKNYKWLYFVLILLLLLGGYYWLGNNNSTDDSEKVELTAPSEVEQATPIDSTESVKEDSVKSENGEGLDESTLPSETQTKDSAKNSPAETVKNHGFSSSANVEQKALEVIRGVYGNGNERKSILGEQYTDIQNRVNEMYRNGLVH